MVLTSWLSWVCIALIQQGWKGTTLLIFSKNFYLYLAYKNKKANPLSPSTTQNVLLTYITSIDTDLLMYLLILNFCINHSWSHSDSYEVNRQLANKINDLPQHAWFCSLPGSFLAMNLNQIMYQKSTLIDCYNQHARVKTREYIKY